MSRACGAAGREPGRDGRPDRGRAPGSSTFPTSCSSTAPPAPRSPARPTSSAATPSSPPTRRASSAARAGTTEVGGPGSPWTRARRRTRWSPSASCSRRSPRTPVPGLPPFQGGAAGYIGYDYGAVLERLPRAAVRRPGHSRRGARAVRLGDRLGPPAGDRVDRLDRAAGDRRRRASARAPRAARRWCGSGSGGRAARRPAAGGASALAARAAEAPSYPVLGVEGAERIGLRSTFTHRGYLDAVARVREYIVAGDIFQANLSQRFQAPLAEPPFELYRRLRRRNPAPFAAYLDFGELAGAERLARAVPPAGRERRPRRDPADQGHPPARAGPMHDAALGRALAESDKDRAENVMIVDLLRNDLSRVCRPGTVRVPELFALEHHPTVHHLVSTVVGELDPARGRRRPAPGRVSRRLDHRRAQGAGDGDHRRAGADAARRVLRLDRLPQRHRRAWTPAS